MSGVFQNIDPPPPHRPVSVYPSAFSAGGGHTRQGERGWGVNILEDARHCSVLNICKYFVRPFIRNTLRHQLKDTFYQPGAVFTAAIYAEQNSLR
jgi:hypothetical protein